MGADGPTLLGEHRRRIRRGSGTCCICQAPLSARNLLGELVTLCERRSSAPSMTHTLRWRVVADRLGGVLRLDRLAALPFGERPGLASVLAGIRGVRRPGAPDAPRTGPWDPCMGMRRGTAAIAGVSG